MILFYFKIYAGNFSLVGEGIQRSEQIQVERPDIRFHDMYALVL
ncbi:hypothetical protein N643_16675 [Salmonella bongori serovar 48:z41:-- str. RKS3044]|nr:hypothetical protein N643_16675 [Salmonella bongori serovar 48:z41:-- str. RKS3044]